MYTFLIFIGGFISGFASLRVIQSKAEKNNAKRDEQLKKEHAEEDAMIMEFHRNQTFDCDSKTLKIITLNPSEKAQDTYYNTDEIFITFCLEDMLSMPEEVSLFLNSQNDNFQMKNMERMIKDDLIPRSILEDDFYKLLDSGKATIYSKVGGRFVDKIMRDEYGFIAGPTAGAGGYKYYLPDGPLFFTFNTWVS